MVLYQSLFVIMVALRYALAGQARLRADLYPVLLVFLFVFVAFRYEVGCDWTGYLAQFRMQGAFDAEFALVQREPLWWLLMEGIDRIGLPYPWVNVAAAAAFFYGIDVLARRQPDPLGFLVVLFPVLVINMPMSGIRQGVAIGLLCLAYVRFIERRTAAYFAIVAVAGLFHASAHVFLLLTPLVGGRYTAGRLLLAAVLAVPGTIALLGSEAAEAALAAYVDSGLDAAGALFRVLALVLTGLVFFVWLARAWRAASPEDHVLVAIGALSMLGLAAILPLSTVIADRLAYYFVPIQAMIFARLPYLPIGWKRLPISAAPYVALLIMFTVWTMFSFHFRTCYVPYDSWILGIDRAPIG